MRVATFCTVMPRKIRIHFSIGMYEYKCILKAKNKQKCSAFQKKTEKGIHFCECCSKRRPIPWKAFVVL